MKTLLLAILLALAPVAPVCGAALAIVLIDLLTGLIRARRANEPITSDQFKRTPVKLAVYLVGIVSAYLVGTYLTGPLVPVVNIVSGMIGMTELKSILENLDEINGGVGIMARINRKLSVDEEL